MRRRCGICSVLCGLLLAISAHSEPPIAAFARLENIRNPSLSPDGRYVAYISVASGDRIAVVMDLLHPESPKTVLRAANDQGFNLKWCRWANDTRLLCGLEEIDPGLLRTQWYSRLMAVNADGSDVKELLQTSLWRQRVDQGFGPLIDITADDPDTVLVESADAKVGGSKRSEFPSVFKLNVNDGTLQLHTLQQPPIRGFLTDGRGNIRLGIGLSGARYVYYARLEGDTLLTPVAKEAGAYRLLAIVPGTNTAYAYSTVDGRLAVCIVQLQDKQKPRTVFRHRLVDVGNLVRTDDGQIYGVSYETDRPAINYLDDTIRTLMENVAKQLPATFNALRSVTPDRKTAVIVATSDTEAGSYYLLEVASGKLTSIGRAYPELNAEQLPRMRTIEYPAADGTPIPGYLTVPTGVDATDADAAKLPLVVLPHGGPTSRDYWRFDFLRLFLASRGYAVLQMNFRGSTGFGTKWQTAARQDWGGLTYADIADGARWAAARGIADPQRMCIVGWSFGGYAAMVGAQRNPDLFQCAASIAGVSNWVEFRDKLSRTNADIAENQFGADDTKLLAQSPEEHAADIDIPVLLIHGRRDFKAPYSQSRRMARALKKADKQFKFVTLDDAEHDLWRESERTTLLTELEQFLRTYLRTHTGK